MTDFIGLFNKYKEWHEWFAGSNHSWWKFWPKRSWDEKVEMLVWVNTGYSLQIRNNEVSRVSGCPKVSQEGIAYPGEGEEQFVLRESQSHSCRQEEQPTRTVTLWLGALGNCMIWMETHVLFLFLPVSAVVSKKQTKKKKLRVKRMELWRNKF